MRLTTYSDFALRLMMYLAVRTGRLSTIPDIAGAYGISANHLMKVVQKLGQAGYVETVRGRGGGMRLGRSAEEIGIGELVRFTEPDMDIVPCFQAGYSDCPLWRACRLKSVLERARLAFLSVLDEFTLADLVRAPGPLRAHLGIDLDLPRGITPVADQAG